MCLIIVVWVATTSEAHVAESSVQRYANSQYCESQPHCLCTCYMRRAMDHPSYAVLSSPPGKTSQHPSVRFILSTTACQIRYQEGIALHCASQVTPTILIVIEDSNDQIDMLSGAAVGSLSGHSRGSQLPLRVPDIQGCPCKK